MYGFLRFFYRKRCHGHCDWSRTWFYFFRHLKEIQTYFLKRTQWAGIADFLQSPPIISLYFVILISFLTSLRILS